MTAEPLPIEIKNLTKAYRVGFLRNRTVHALQGVSLRVEPGQVYGLLGPNGAGKSTTIKILMNLVQPDGGIAHLFGGNPAHAEVRRKIGFLPENPAPYEYLTGREFVSLCGRLFGLSGKELERRVTEVLGAVEMSAAAKLQIRRYSKGMVQRIALAQALIGKPSLLVLDEPTSGLDPLGRRQMRDLILAQRDQGTTILFCTHIIPDVEALCDRVALLVGGKLDREGSVQELVSANTPAMELITEGISETQVSNLGIQLLEVKPAGSQLISRVETPHAQALLSAVIQSGGRVARFQPARFSLEDLFLQTLKDSGQKVGGEIR